MHSFLVMSLVAATASLTLRWLVIPVPTAAGLVGGLPFPLLAPLAPVILFSGAFQCRPAALPVRIRRSAMWLTVAGAGASTAIFVAQDLVAKALTGQGQFADTRNLIGYLGLVLALGRFSATAAAILPIGWAVLSAVFSTANHGYWWAWPTAPDSEPRAWLAAGALAVAGTAIHLGTAHERRLRYRRG